MSEQTRIFRSQNEWMERLYWSLLYMQYFKSLIPVSIGFSRVAHFQYSRTHLKLCTVQLCTRKQNNKGCVYMLRKMIIIGSKTGVIKKVLTCAAFSHTFRPPNQNDMSCVCGTILLFNNLFICYQTPVMDIPQCKIFMILYLRTEVVSKVKI